MPIAYEAPDHPAKYARRPLANVPFAADEDVSTKTCFILSVTLCNTAATATTFTMKDKQGTPIELFDAYSLNASITQTFEFPNGIKMVSGFDIQASQDGLRAEIVYRENP